MAEPLRIALGNLSRILGGAELMTRTLALGLAERGHRVVVLCRRGAPLWQRLRGELPCEPVPGGFDLNPRAVWAAARALRAHAPQVLMTMTQKDPRITGVAARLLGIPVVVRHAMDVPLRDRAHHRLLFGRLPAHLVANSRATRRTLLESAPWLEPGRVSVIHNGVDVERIQATAPADLGLPAGAVAIGFIGRFEPRKGVAELAAAWVRVAERVPAAHLVLAGRGGELEAELRRSLGPARRVHWLGFREDAAAVVRALDVLVLPSRREGFGLVLAEAMAAGVAVVAADASNLPELVDDRVEGRLVPAGDAEALAGALCELAEDPALRERMGAAGAARARRDFSLPRMLDEYERLLRRFARSSAA